MIINDTPVAAELIDILTELKAQLAINHIPLLKDLRDTPNDIMVTCPYHKDGQERKPSAGLRKTDGQFHCFTCGETKSLQEVISYCFGKEDDLFGAFGWKWILTNFISISVVERKGIPIDFQRGQESINTNTTVSEKELDEYRVYHPYMWQRKLTPEAVELFDIGFDKKTQSLTFPIRAESGECTAIVRRSVTSKFFNIPTGVDKPIYGLYELYQLQDFPKEIIICEGVLDAITCWVYGKYAVALLGLGSVAQIEQLNRLPCRKYILATDNDKAGEDARKRLRKSIKNKLITEYIFPSGKKDINELLQEEFDNLEEIF